jgi:hypothetical protein
VIKSAAKATPPGGHRHPHQRRIPSTALTEFAQRLIVAQNQIRISRSFDDLHAAVRKVSHAVHGIGELAVYDTSTRIGEFLKVRPQMVYLHRGTKEGAKALRSGLLPKTLLVEELPKAFNRLTPSEIEDCLCIYKTQLRRLVD